MLWLIFYIGPFFLQLSCYQKELMLKLVILKQDSVHMTNVADAHMSQRPCCGRRDNILKKEHTIQKGYSCCEEYLRKKSGSFFLQYELAKKG